MRSRFAQFLFVAAATAALSSCYGTKIFKGPVTTERTGLLADTIRAEQKVILAKLTSLEARMNEESDQRTSSNASLQQSIRELEEAVRTLVSRMDDSQQMNSTGGRGPSVGSRPAQPDQAEQAYQAAYSDVTKGRYELATQEFQDFLTQYPDSPRIAEAHFYLGESQYAQERYLEAAGEYQKVTHDFPASRLAPAAYLKMGRAYVQLEERSLAEKAFKTLMTKHPNSEEAKQAESALKQLGG